MNYTITDSMLIFQPVHSGQPEINGTGSGKGREGAACKIYTGGAGDGGAFEYLFNTEDAICSGEDISIHLSDGSSYNLYLL